MRRHYLDNLRWATVLLVMLYHVIYMYNGVITAGVVGPFAPVQPQDAVQYLLYPWFMVLLFVVSGASARLALERQPPKAFAVRRTEKLLVPSTLGLLVFQWVLGGFNMALAGAFDTLPPLPAPVLWLIMAVPAAAFCGLPRCSGFFPWRWSCCAGLKRAASAASAGGLAPSPWRRWACPFGPRRRC